MTPPSWRDVASLAFPGASSKTCARAYVCARYPRSVSPARTNEVTAGPARTRAGAERRACAWAGRRREAPGGWAQENKGNPVKQYEPYFSQTHEYETELDIRTVGVTPLITYDAVGRVIKFQNPDQTFRTTAYSPWLESASDENDNHDIVSNTHKGTPTLTHFDPLGRPFLVQADNGTQSAHLFYDTRTTLDIENQPLAVIDPLGRTCQTHVFSMSGRLLVETNIDKGLRIMLQDVTGAPVRRWDARSQAFRFEYDEVRRPTNLWLSINGAAEVLLERRYYGEAAATPTTGNLRGQLILLFDQAGKTELGPFDFKGNLNESRRTLAQNYTSVIDWNATGVALGGVDDPAAAESAAVLLLESEEWLEIREYDALNRVTSLTTPDGSVYEPTFNEAGLLETVDVNVRGVSATSFVSNIDYNAKGQRTLIEYANGTKTEYSYHELNFRLTDLVTTRVGDSKKLQDLTYSYDPVGNITAIADAADDVDVFFVNTVIPASQIFQYDAIYRLVQATGREHQSIGAAPIGVDSAPIQNLPHNNDPSAVRTYTETYDYDKVGNILELFHDAGMGAATWRRWYDYGPFTNDVPNTNRLRSTSGPGDTEGVVPYSVQYGTPDAHGNIASMPHLSGGITYSPFDQMTSANNTTQTTYFTYGADGQRVRKVFDTNANLIKERIYLGGYEIYRERTVTPSPTVQLERHTLHVMDDSRRIAMVETKTISGGAPVSSPANLFRFQHTNHLGSAHLECDHNGAVISFEELHPYGTSAYRSTPSSTVVSARRYRYTGKERDEETGLDYFGARYFAPWLGRWTSADPLGLQAGLNLYLYGRASPIVMVDPNGMQDGPWYAPKTALNPPPMAEPAPSARGEIQRASKLKAERESKLMANPPAPPGAKWPEGKVAVGVEYLPDDDPEVLRAVSGTGVIEGGDVDAFAKGMWNGPASWFGLPQFEIDEYNAGAAWLGEGFGKNLALQGIGKVAGWVLGKGVAALRAGSQFADEAAVGVEEAWAADKALKSGISVSDEVLGMSSGDATAALSGMRGGGGHAMRKLVDAGLIANKGTLASRSEKFQELITPILRLPTHRFDWTVGATPARGFIGRAGGQDVFVFVATDGRFKGKVITSGIVQAGDWALWGLSK